MPSPSPTMRSASARAASTHSRSRLRDARRRSLRPFWRSPMIVPSPRRSRSTSANSNPSVVRTSARRRSSASGVGAPPTSRHRLALSPRPTRPRSWWSCAMPNLAASRITITVAFGTSTPTSMTVVATSTSRCPVRKSRMVSSFSARPTRPWSSPTRRPTSSPAVRLAKVSSAERTSSVADSSMSGHTT